MAFPTGKVGSRQCQCIPSASLRVRIALTNILTPSLQGLNIALVVFNLWDLFCFCPLKDYRHMLHTPHPQLGVLKFFYFFITCIYCV